MIHTLQMGHTPEILYKLTRSHQRGHHRAYRVFTRSCKLYPNTDPVG